MEYKAAAFACALTIFASLGAGICQAQTATPQDAPPIGTLQDAADAHQRGDYASARQIFQSLAEQGDVTAQFDLAVMNANGHGASPNLPEALKWYRAAAEQGDAESFANLGSLFENGSGVPLDYVRAYVMFDAAARLGRGNAAQTARASRDSLAAKMATAQAIQAQDLARQCQALTAKACSERLLSGEAFSPANQALDAPMTIKLEADHGIYVAPVVVNGNLNLKFGVDTGASDVSIPADVVMTLMNSGTLAKSDFIGERMVTLADGSKKRTQAFRLRSLKLGDLVLENVTASVAPANAPLLLGQSFLSRLKSWSLDNGTHTLSVK